MQYDKVYFQWCLAVANISSNFWLLVFLCLFVLFWYSVCTPFSFAILYFEAYLLFKHWNNGSNCYCNNTKEKEENVRPLKSKTILENNVILVCHIDSFSPWLFQDDYVSVNDSSYRVLNLLHYCI